MFEGELVDFPESVVEKNPGDGFVETDELFDSLLFDLLEEDTTSSDCNGIHSNHQFVSLLSEPVVPPTGLTVTRRYRRKHLKPNEDHKYRKVDGRKRKINPSYMPALRVLKKDIRRKYQEMYSNVINQHDPLLLHRFLKEFCTPSCQYLFHLPAASNPISLGDTLSDILFGLVQIQLKLPDMIHQFSEIEIHVPYHTNGSYIQSTARFQGTKLFQLAVDPLADAVQQSSTIPTSPSTALLLSLASSTSSSSMPSSASSSPAVSIIVHSNMNHLNTVTTVPSTLSAVSHLWLSHHSEDYGHCNSPVSTPNSQELEEIAKQVDLQLLPRLQSLQLYPLVTPQEITLEGRFSMHLNTSYQIESFQFEVKRVIKQVQHQSQESY